MDEYYNEAILKINTILNGDSNDEKGDLQDILSLVQQYKFSVDTALKEILEALKTSDTVVQKIYKTLS
ncbi:hypothetical protein LCGC14_0175720 [marine sediment metagenome]|uniref:Uncharacterized protein n=1 Tax=marine sediment metagenome TaxID=412755 RepID=A0A0F9XTT1_9ZZZZ